MVWSPGSRAGTLFPVTGFLAGLRKLDTIWFDLVFPREAVLGQVLPVLVRGLRISVECDHFIQFWDFGLSLGKNSLVQDL